MIRKNIGSACAYLVTNDEIVREDIVKVCAYLVKNNKIASRNMVKQVCVFSEKSGN